MKRLLSNRDPSSTVNLEPFLRDITDAVLAFSYQGDGTRLTHSHAGGGAVSACDAEPIGLIVGELVANAVHYAHPTGIEGRIDVRSAATGANGAFCIEVEDDGVGLPEAFDTLADGGEGLEAVRQLAGEMGADLQFIDDGVGLSVRLELPLALSTGAQSGILAQ